MKKVIFKVWIPIQYTWNENKTIQNKILGTGCWSTEYEGEGLFHTWGVCYEEFETGPGNYSIALVQLPNGTIETILPSNLKFI